MKPTATNPFKFVTPLILSAALIACGQGQPPSTATSEAPSGEASFRQFGDTRVYYTTLQSTFLEPAIASQYNITPASDKGLVNISVITGNAIARTEASVSGTVSNLIGHQQNLGFRETREGDSVFYLAPFSIDFEDQLTFEIQVSLPDQPPHNLTFNHTFQLSR